MPLMTTARLASNDHITKPVDPEKLFETLLKWLPKPQA